MAAIKFDKDGHPLNIKFDKDGNPYSDVAESTVGNLLNHIYSGDLKEGLEAINAAGRSTLDPTKSIIGNISIGPGNPELANAMPMGSKEQIKKTIESVEKYRRPIINTLSTATGATLASPGIATTGLGALLGAEGGALINKVIDKATGSEDERTPMEEFVVDPAISAATSMILPAGGKALSKTFPALKGVGQKILEYPMTKAIAAKVPIKEFVANLERTGEIPVGSGPSVLKHFADIGMEVEKGYVMPASSAAWALQRIASNPYIQQPFLGPVTGVVAGATNASNSVNNMSKNISTGISNALKNVLENKKDKTVGQILSDKLGN